MRRPVWLFSRDSEQFDAPPLTTGGLKAFFLATGKTAAETDVTLVHFRDETAFRGWLRDEWPGRVRLAAEAAAAAGRSPVFAFSCYTWNVAGFLETARIVKTAVPDSIVVAGGPHVQRAEDYLGVEAIDAVVLGEGEETFAALLDTPSSAGWHGVEGCAFLDRGRVVRTRPRARAADLDRFPSALDVVPLRDAAGRPLYTQAAYETTRGCPYRCAFCEWGTGAIGTRMHQLSLGRIGSDLQRLVAGGITDLWLSDSNFGALREDETKADLVIDLRRRTGLPRNFATSWSKNHNARVQRIVRRLHREGLLSHVHLALQTLTPRALEWSHRQNMRANDYEPIVRSLAAEGVPVAAELIWGLPGDTLAEFERNLGQLLGIFPNVNIFGYTLLPGTEFFDRREELALETVAVAGYGKARGEYVVGCRTFSRNEGEEGYFLITAWIVLARGQILPRTLRWLALAGVRGVPALMRGLLRDLLDDRDDGGARIEIYERRAELYVDLLRKTGRTYRTLARSLVRRLTEAGAAASADRALRILELDASLAPRPGGRATRVRRFVWDAPAAERALARMELPPEDVFRPLDGPLAVTIESPGGLGEALRDPDGGEWMRGRIGAQRLFRPTRTRSAQVPSPSGHLANTE